jgi:type IV pilus assembly protein PilE
MSQAKRQRHLIRQSGFSLIELIIAVAIVGILAKLAYGSYQGSIQKSRRTQAKAVLSEAAQFMERNMTLYNCYNYATQSECVAGTGTALTLPTSWTSIPSGGAYYTVAFASGFPTATAYTLTATPISGSTQATDACGTFTLTHQNVRGVTSNTSGTTAIDCWGR